MTSRSTDQYICETLEGEGEVLTKFCVYCIKRDGYLLLALPLDRDAAKATLSLYQPQAFLARVLMKFVFSLINLNLHRLLPSRAITIRRNSALAQIKCDPIKIGFLLGNPNAERRRAIILHEGENGYLVDKVGLSGKARLSVTKELKIIQALPSCNQGLPEVSNFHEEGSWASYTTRYLSGKAPKDSDQSKIIHLLHNWLSYSKLKVLGETKQWQMLEAYAREHQADKLFERIAGASSLGVKVGVFHGDFAPWNIKLSNAGEVHVMDWEHGSLNGPSGWDWLHFMIQKASLVDHLSAGKILDLCRQWANTNEGKAFLIEAGWGEKVEFWIGSYLLYSSWIAGFDRDILIREWSRIR